MDKKEFAQLAMALRTYYPKENLLPNKEAMALWYQQLNDINYQVAEAALHKWVATQKWSPSIAEMREMAANVTEGDIPDWSDGWEQVLKAIRNFGSYRVREAMESFDPLTRQVVERLDFKEICISEKIAVDRANFRMIYQQIAERKQKDSQLQIGLKDIIGQIQIEHRKGLQQGDIKGISASGQEA